jgi:CRP-like cAMP-binding protein
MTFLLSASTPYPSSASKEFYQPKTFQFKRHENLQRYGLCYGLWQIRSGYVRSLTLGLEGEAIPLGFWCAGDIVGSAIAQVNPYEAQCLTAVTADYLGNTYSFSQEAALKQIRQSNDLLRIAHCRQSEMRLLLFLGWLAQRFGKAVSEGQQIKPKLTHQEIADSIGSTRVTVTRLLKVLEFEGKIRWKSREKIVYSKTFEQLYQPLSRIKQAG